MLVWLSVWSEVHIVSIWSSHCHYHPHHLLPHLNPDWFYPIWYRLTQVVQESRPLNGCSFLGGGGARSYAQRRNCDS